MGMPHQECYVRLRPSPIHGIGVFAIKDIPAGFDPFKNNHEEFLEIPEEEINKITGEDRLLYEDFCVFEDGVVYCPQHFELMDTSWYINHSKTPNCYWHETYKDDGTFLTSRNIEPGEELTVDYDTYSER